MLQFVAVDDRRKLEDYEEVDAVAPAVRALRAEAAALMPRLAGRTVWLVNSTARGGGVAEMLPPLVAVLRELGVRTEWVVIGSEEQEFFQLTKHLHNLIHAEGEPRLGRAERELFERVNRENAEALRPHVRAGDVLIVHDPQPLPLAALLRESVPLVTIWRCHIGVEVENAATLAAWEFLSPWLAAYDHTVFSAAEYVPRSLASRATVIYPGIDPLAAKNRDLPPREVADVMCSAGLIVCPEPTVRPVFAAVAQRSLPDGRWAAANAGEGIGLLTRPIVTQISRWDLLKGWLPLMLAFAQLKRSAYSAATEDPLHQRRLELARLVLAGPEPAAIQDDPGAQSMLEELRAAYVALDSSVQRDIAILALPMASRDENALMVNALQRASTIVVQNSLREGFGLTIAEAMWKRMPVLSNSRACGPRHQLRDGVDGRLVEDPEDISGLASALIEMLADPLRLERWGQAGQERVREHFLMFSQLRAWGRLLTEMLSGR